MSADVLVGACVAPKLRQHLTAELTGAALAAKTTAAIAASHAGGSLSSCERVVRAAAAAGGGPGAGGVAALPQALVPAGCWGRGGEFISAHFVFTNLSACFVCQIASLAIAYGSVVDVLQLAALLHLPLFLPLRH